MDRTVDAPGAVKGKQAITQIGFDPEEVAERLARDTAEVLRSVEALEDGRGPTDETLRTLICI